MTVSADEETTVEGGVAYAHVFVSQLYQLLYKFGARLPSGMRPISRTPMHNDHVNW